METGLGRNRRRGSGRSAEICFEKACNLGDAVVVDVERAHPHLVQQGGEQAEDAAGPRDSTARRLQGIRHRGDRAERRQRRVRLVAVLLLIFVRPPAILLRRTRLKNAFWEAGCWINCNR